MKVPKDLGIKIGSPLEVLWTTVKNNVEAEIKIAEDGLIVNKTLLDIAKEKIAEEQRKTKPLNKAE